jgi:hypothetical protein
MMMQGAIAGVAARGQVRGGKSFRHCGHTRQKEREKG